MSEEKRRHRTAGWSSIGSPMMSSPQTGGGLLGTEQRGNWGHSLPVSARKPTSYSWTRGEGAKKARQFYCGTTWVTLSKFMHLRKKEQRDVCVFQQQLWAERALRPFPPSLPPPSFHRHLAALGAMTHWPSKKHSSTHPEVLPAKSSSSSSPHNSSLFWEAAEGTVWGFFSPSYTAESPKAHSVNSSSITASLIGKDF